ncbi:MAG: metallophosphoesterase [Sedimentisphaerales bacterium]|nr:metallophosphoesterase [Sedimentisphaerales bacterium]
MKEVEKIISIPRALIFLVIIGLAISRGYCGTFSFAIIADPHIDGSAEHVRKFEAAVNWLIDNKDSKDIEIVVVAGDIAWGGDGEVRNLEVAKEILDRLNSVGIAYVPLIGDNEVQAGCEKEYSEVFGGQYQYLCGVFENWQKAFFSVEGKYFQNFSFDYKDCHFICADFASRKAGDEGGVLHDFRGGTWPWFKNDIEKCTKAKKENIVIMTHIGMFRTGIQVADQYLFSKSEMEKIKKFLYPYRKHVDSNYAGHIHQNWHATVWSGWFNTLYQVRVTDEPWYDTRWPESDDHELTVRWVQVDNGGETIIYDQHIVDVGNENTKKDLETGEEAREIFDPNSLIGESEES